MHGRANFTARAARWSAAHRKAAIFGWLAFVIVAFVIGGSAGMVTLKAGEGGNGQSRLADQQATRHRWWLWWPCEACGGTKLPLRGCADFERSNRVRGSHLAGTLINSARVARRVEGGSSSREPTPPCGMTRHSATGWYACRVALFGIARSCRSRSGGSMPPGLRRTELRATSCSPTTRSSRPRRQWAEKLGETAGLTGPRESPARYSGPNGAGDGPLMLTPRPRYSRSCRLLRSASQGPPRGPGENAAPQQPRRCAGSLARQLSRHTTQNRWRSAATPTRCRRS